MDESGKRLLAELRGFPQALREVVRGLTDAQLDTPYRAGGWTARQVVHHCADSHMHAFLRMRFIAAVDHPTITPYDQEVWAAEESARTGPVEPSLRLLEGLHERWCGFLEHLPDAAWARTAHHPERGEVTMMGMLKTYAGHGTKHCGHIRSLREARSW